MKKILILVFALTLITGCDSESAPDCFKTAGNIIQQENTVANFDKILIYEGVELIIKEGAIQNVIIESGSNLIGNVSVEVINNQLIAKDNNGCNLVRDYGVTKIIVTAPNIVEIRNSSEQSVRSEGVLTYPDLRLLSEDYQSDYLNVGDFYVSINNTNLTITSNGISNFYIDGQTTNLTVGFYAADSRFEGRNLIADNVNITNKSSNDMLVNPQLKITGDIFSLGDVRAFNQPAIVEVTEHYRGRLIFE
ncbi:MAG: hypothetical protein COB73_09260 [Flavobacteriaceae bacterium]|nr:MAG: hypothetical protein COB73_09260 [Flavobacteriaceae bacterium]